MKGIIRSAVSAFVALVYLAQLSGCSGDTSSSPHQGHASARQKLGAPVGYTLVPSDTISAGLTVGETPMAADVTSDGQARVSIPLWVPPARGGMQPSLSLIYSSRAGQGPLGQGWGIAGTSRIAPCRSTPSQDGAYGQLFYCLDGERLVQVGTFNGFDEFRAEMNGYDQILKKSANTFEVRRRDGLIATYTASNGRSFELASLKDRSNNEIDYVYSADSARLLQEIDYGGPNQRKVILTYEVRPDRRNQNFFSLAVTLDKRVKQIDLLGPTGLSDSAYQSQATASVLKTYKLGYLDASVSSTSRLSTVQECDGAGVCKSPLTFSYSPETMAFDAVPLILPGLPIGSQLGGNASPTALGVITWMNSFDFADVDADGLDDILYRSEPDQMTGVSKWKMRLNSPNGFGPEQNTGFPLSTALNASHPLQLVNLNRSPLVEALAPAFIPSGNGNTTETDYLPFSFDPVNGGFTTQTTVASMIPFLVAPGDLLESSALGDLNGDGKPDLVVKQNCVSTGTPSQAWCDLAWAPNASGTSDITFTAPTTLSFIAQGQCPMYGSCQPDETGTVQTRADSPIYIVDVDGDGVNELLIAQRAPQGSPSQFRDNLIIFHPGLVDSAGHTSWQSTALPPTGLRSFGDFNGDGYTDTVRFDPAGTNTPAQINVGLNIGLPPAPGWAGFTESVATISPALGSSGLANVGSPNEVRVADFTGDGLDDLLLVSTMTLLVSDGVGGFSAVSNPTFPISPGLDSFGGNYTQQNTRRRFEQVLDYNGDGLADVSVMRSANLATAGQPYVYQRHGQPPGLLQTVNGGALTPSMTFEYGAAAPGAQFYTPSSSCVYPQACLKRGMWLVTRATQESNNPNLPHQVSYGYADGRFDLTGRGWLGFATNTVTNTADGRVRVTNFDNATALVNPSVSEERIYPYAFMPQHEIEDLALLGGVRSRAEIFSTYSATYPLPAQNGNLASIFPLSRRSTEYEDPGTGTYDALASSRSTSTFDPTYGNLTTSTWEEFDTAFTAGGAIPSGVAVRTVTTNTTFGALDQSNWLIARPTLVQVSSTEPARLDAAARTVTRTTGFSYEPGTTLVHTVEIEPNTQPAETPTTSGFDRLVTYHHDPFGNIDQISDAASGTTRHTSIVWDSLESAFPSQVINELSQTTTLYYHAGTGQLAVADTPLGTRTITGFDGFGRVKSVDRPNDADSAVTWGLSAGHLTMTSQTAGNGGFTIYKDKWANVVRKEWKGFLGKHVAQTFGYDTEGRLTGASFPFYDQTNPPEEGDSASFGYDKRGRWTVTVSPLLETSGASYRGRQTEVSDAMGHVTQYDHDGSGRLTHISRQDDAVLGHTVQTGYEYGPFGQLETVIDSAGNQTSMQHDVLGRRIGATDPDTGTQSILYDGRGQMKFAADATGAALTFTYDELGRPQLVSSAAGTDEYDWDTAPNGIGQLAATTSADGVKTNYDYSALGEPDHSTWSIDGSDFTFESTFDSFGRLNTLSYPAVGSSQFTAQYNYTPEGEVQSISDASVTNGAVIWSVRAKNADGQSTSEFFGNGVRTFRSYNHDHRLQYQESKSGPTLQGGNGATTIQQLVLEYDRDGVVKARHDPLNRTTEDFKHDFLHRLTNWTLYQNCQKASTTYFYGDTGNLTGTEVDSGPGVSVSYGYGVGAGPGAATSLAPQGGSAASYSYGSGGLQSTSPSRSQTYTAFQLPKTVTTARGTTTLSYDANHGRALKQSPNGTSTSYAGGGLYEQIGTASSSLHLFNVGGVAQLRWLQPSGQNPTPSDTRYLHSDHLGTPETISGASGTVAERLKYEPFGERRFEYAIAAPAVKTHQSTIGFGGHEPEDDLGLTNMGGREYDPHLARFLTADPIVHSFASSEALNRYSYARNSPVTLTDPTGWDPSGGSIWGSAGGDWGGFSFGFSYSSAGTGSAANPGEPTQGGGPRPNIAPANVGANRADSSGNGWTGTVQEAINSYTPAGYIAQARNALSKWAHSLGPDVTGRDLALYDFLASQVNANGRLLFGQEYLVSDGWTYGINAVDSLSQGYHEHGIAGALGAYGKLLGEGFPGFSLVAATVRYQLADANEASSYETSQNLNYEVASAVLGVAAAAAGGGLGPVRQGAAGVARAVADLEGAGGRVLGREVTIESGGVRTRPDLFVELPSGQQVFLEIKTGPSAGLTPNQAAAFPKIWTQGGVPRGANAAAAGLTPGVPIGPTPVWTVHYPWPLP
ncbi:MAG: RHS repeat-associated core domain-containing protein [Myxococcaceae bacterium]